MHFPTYEAHTPEQLSYNFLLWEMKEILNLFTRAAVFVILEKHKNHSSTDPFMSTSEHPSSLNMIQPTHFYIKYQMSWRVIVLQKADDCQCGCFSN